MTAQLLVIHRVYPIGECENRFTLDTWIDLSPTLWGCSSITGLTASGCFTRVHIMSIITITSSFAPTLNKAGKISAQSEKNALLLNSATAAAVLGVALTGRGTIATMARNGLKNHAVTLETLLSAEVLDGSQWGDLLALLVAAHGVGQFSRATMKGKQGCANYMEGVMSACSAAISRAETVKQQDRAIAMHDAAVNDAGNVARLIAVTQAQIDEATLAATEVAPVELGELV